MEVKITELKTLTEKLFNHCDKMRLKTVEIPFDYYWDVPGKFRYDNYCKPKEIVVGQISEDWDLLQQLLNGKIEPITYHLVLLSSILRAIGEMEIR